jgi:hypothetical protein
MLEECVADQASPVKIVKQRQGYWYIEKLNDVNKLVVASTSASGGFGKLNPTFAATEYTTTPYALGARIPRATRANADFDLGKRAVRRLIEALRLLREARVATQLTTSTNWNAANRVAWTTSPTANPLLDLFAGLGKSTMPANLMVLPESLAPYFYTDFVRIFRQAGGQLPRILTARSRFISGGVNVYTWAPQYPSSAGSTNVALVRTPEDLDELATSVTFRWIGKSADGAVKDGILVRQFFDEEGQADVYVAAHDDIEVNVSNLVGAVLVGVA